MSLKTWITIGILVGSTVGGSLPSLWGDTFFSFSSILLSTLGGFAGIWAGYKMYQTLS